MYSSTFMEVTCAIKLSTHLEPYSFLFMLFYNSFLFVAITVQDWQSLVQSDHHLNSSYCEPNKTVQSTAAGFSLSKYEVFWKFTWYLALNYRLPVYLRILWEKIPFEYQLYL